MTLAPQALQCYILCTPKMSLLSISSILCSSCYSHIFIWLHFEVSSKTNWVTGFPSKGMFTLKVTSLHARWVDKSYLDIFVTHYTMPYRYRLFARVMWYNYYGNFGFVLSCCWAFFLQTQYAFSIIAPSHIVCFI